MRTFGNHLERLHPNTTSERCQVIPMPPACWCRAEKQTSFTLVFDKLLAICRDHRNARYLRDTAHSCTDVMNSSHITSLFLETIYQSSIFTVVTKYNHTNSILIYHVTVDAKAIVSSFAVGINDVRITWGLSATRNSLQVLPKWEREIHNRPISFALSPEHIDKQVFS